MRLFTQLMGLLIAFTLVSCGAGNPLPAAPTADFTANDLSDVPNRVSPTSLPEVCNCTLRFDHISIEQGLSQSSVRVIFQDNIGFLWFGTEDGLNRYDGYTFKTFKPDPDNPNSMSDRWISAIVQDKEGYLWIGTRQGGLNRYDPKTENFSHFNHDENDPFSISDDHINTLYLDINDNLWVGTQEGLDMFNRVTHTFTRYSYSPSEPNSLTGKNVTVIYQDGRGCYLGSFQCVARELLLNDCAQKRSLCRATVKLDICNQTSKPEEKLTRRRRNQQLEVEAANRTRKIHHTLTHAPRPDSRHRKACRP